MTNITKRFGTTTALDNVSFRLRQGTVHALLGENGAGKTTLMRIAFAVEFPDTGTVDVRGAPRSIRTPGDAIAAGIGMVHQHFTNVGAMTVAENVALGGRGRFRGEAAAKLVVEIGARTGLVLDPFTRAEQLSVGAQQRLEIVKALARNAKILVLDEPTAVLSPNEADDLLNWLSAYARAGNAVVLITHKLREALLIADDVSVLRRGRAVLNASAASLTTESLTLAMVGEQLREATLGPAANEPGAVVVSARGLNVVVVDHGAAISAIRNASFEIRTGELVGIAAVEGAGQRALLRSLARRQPVAGGQLTLPTDIGFVPEDRHRDALVLDYDASENVALKDAGTRRGRMRWRSVRQRTATMVSEFDVRGAERSLPVRSLSGGNQQKLVLARELFGGPSLVIVENPTRGLDIRATREVHQRLRVVAALGAAVVVYSSDLDEVLTLATRILVVHSGNVLETPHDREAVARAMLGVR